MRSQHFSPLAFLFALIIMGFAGHVSAQQTHTVQSASPALQMPAQVAPVNLDPETGGREQKSRTSEAIGGSKPLEANAPDTAGTVQTTAAEIKRSLTPSEIEELKDAK